MSDVQAEEADPTSPGPPRDTTRRISNRWILAGVALITAAALITAIPVLIEMWAKPLQSAREQHRLDDAIERQWDEPDPPRQDNPHSADDKLFARLYLPALDRHWVVVRGVDEADIEHAPGVYPDSPPPGQPGNVAIFGHRRKKLFWNLDKLQRGDTVFLETRTQWFTYRVYNTKTVTPSDTSVVTWRPAEASGRPARPLLTLITCAPKLSTTKRLIVQAEQTAARSRKAGPPAGIPTS